MSACVACDTLMAPCGSATCRNRRTRVFCAHADQNGEGAHWMDAGERCPLMPCRRILNIVSPTPFVRCGLPEDHPIHDPLSRYSTHVYSPEPEDD